MQKLLKFFLIIKTTFFYLNTSDAGLEELVQLSNYSRLNFAELNLPYLEIYNATGLDVSFDLYSAHLLKIPPRTVTKPFLSYKQVGENYKGINQIIRNDTNSFLTQETLSREVINVPSQGVIYISASEFRGPKNLSSEKNYMHSCGFVEIQEGLYTHVKGNQIIFSMESSFDLIPIILLTSSEEFWPKGLDSDQVAKQTKLYRKYFLDGIKNISAQEIWQDFYNKPSGVREVKRDQEIIISLTSYPARFETTWLAIESLLRQENKPDRIVLNLFEDEFPGRELPWMIQQQIKRGLEINWCEENLKVFLKVIPTVQKFPKAAVVAVDDDVIYPKNRLGDLIKGYQQYPDCVICSDGRIIKTLDDYILPVNAWHFTGWYPSSEERAPNSDIIPEGVFGVLFPPNCFYKDLPCKELFFDLCPTDDDLWMYTMTVMAGKKITKINRFKQALVNIDTSQDVLSSLWRVNFSNRSSKLTNYFDRVVSHYNLLPEKKTCISLRFLKEENLSSLKYDALLDFNTVDSDIKTPINLLESFGSAEPAGIWTFGGRSEFELYFCNIRSVYRIIFGGRPFIHPEKKQFSLIIEHKKNIKFSKIFTEEKESKFSFLCRPNENIMHFEFITPDFVCPSYFNICPDFRELGYYISKFGMYKINASISEINIGQDLNFSSPIDLGQGFHEMEESGIWSSDHGEFSLVFEELNIPYVISIYGRGFLEKNSYTIFQENEKLCIGQWEKTHPFEFLNFIYTPTSAITQFLLKLENAASPKALGESNDDRELGIFLRKVTINKK